MINRQGPRAGAERFSDFWFGFLVAGQRLMTMVLESAAMTPRGRSSLLDAKGSVLTFDTNSVGPASGLPLCVGPRAAVLKPWQRLCQK
jgi:hypothetical protein